MLITPPKTLKISKKKFTTTRLAHPYPPLPTT